MPLIRSATGSDPLPPARLSRRCALLRHTLPCALAVAATVGAHAAAAQVRDPGETLSAGANAEPMSDDSGPLGEVSRPVHGDGTIGESSGSTGRSGSVRGASTRSMLSGPVSELSRGPVSEGRTLGGGGSMTENSAGAVKHDIDRPLGSRISQPLRELGPLQDHMRALRQGTAPPAQVVDAPISAEIPPEGLETDPTLDDAAFDDVPFDEAQMHDEQAHEDVDAVAVEEPQAAAEEPLPAADHADHPTGDD